eukprot:scaffold107132_cov36-Phaeocystis_antarctica.AAC.2
MDGWRSVLPSGPWGRVVGFRRRGLVRWKDRPSISLPQNPRPKPTVYSINYKMPQLRFWARSPMRCQALDTALRRGPHIHCPIALFA